MHSNPVGRDSVNDMGMSRMKRPLLTPPIQRKHLYYRLTWFWVWGGVMRFFRVRGADGVHHLPPTGQPTILISNHQNGLMDPLVSCAFMSAQIHWLTRADVFWNPLARHIMYGYNQLPIYRRRDRVEDLRERNDIIFDVCVDRLEKGAAMGIFPEGNHNLFPSLRELRGGLTEMVARSAAKHPQLKHMLQVVPVGLDYESYATAGSQLRLRVGAPIPFGNLIDAEGILDKPAFNNRVRQAMGEVMVNIQPEEGQPFLHDAVRACRTTDMDIPDFRAFRERLEHWAARWVADPSWAERVKSSHVACVEAFRQTSAPGRPEAWGCQANDTRTRIPAMGLLNVLAWIANLPTWPAMKGIQHRVKRMVSKDDFVATLSVGLAIIFYPIIWLLWAGVGGWLAPEGWGWMAAAGMWIWGQAGSKFHDHVQGLRIQHRDANNGQVFWNDPSQAKAREAWSNYLSILHESAP